MATSGDQPPVDGGGKRRAASFQDRLPQARGAVASALASVSSATTERLAKLRSRSTDTLLKRAMSAPPSSWKANVHGLARRARAAATRATSAPHYFTWERGAPHGAATTFELHGEDAGAASAYFHIVADGVSAPFGRQSLAMHESPPASSALLAAELVRAVQQALADFTNGDAERLDGLETLEAIVVDAVRATRIKLFRHRQSRLAATLAVAYFDRWSGRLLTFTLGDSKCVVVRGNEIVFESQAVLRDFNMPTVVSLASQVSRADYVLESFALQAGDICMTFSDGIGDNLYKDDIELAVQAAGLQTINTTTNNGSSNSRSNDNDDEHTRDALQQLCDELVYQSQMKISIERARELMVSAEKDAVAADGPENDYGADSENEASNANTRISVHGGAVRGLFPFATAAALEYRARALEESLPPNEAADSAVRTGDKVVDHLACSLALYEQHRVKRTLDRQVVLVRKPSGRSKNKRHYSLLQLKRMAEMQTKKPDDITLFATQFR